MTYERKWSTWITLSKTVSLFEIGWTFIEKSRPEHNPNWTRSCDLGRPEVAGNFFTGRNVKTTEGYIVENWIYPLKKPGLASSPYSNFCSNSNLNNIPKIPERSFLSALYQHGWLSLKVLPLIIFSLLINSFIYRDSTPTHNHVYMAADQRQPTLLLSHCPSTKR